jgi:hypothetical protein
MALLKSYSGASEFTTIFLYQITTKGVFESTRYNPGHQKPGRCMENHPRQQRLTITNG